jgi:DNA-directed DNA polymerase III PolC
VYSFHAGVNTPEEIAARAKTLDMPAIALTDTNRMSGLIRFYCACKEAGIKPILGVELSEPGRPDDTIVLLAKNAGGYGDICEIITKRHLNAATFTFRNVFNKPWPDLFLITGSPALLEQLAATPNRPNLYGELVSNSPLTRQHSSAVAGTAARLGLRLVVSNNTFFLDRSDWETHRILRAIGENATLSRLRSDEYASLSAYLRPEGDMRKLFPDHHDAIANTARIADACNAELRLNEWIMPAIQTGTNETPAEHLRKLAHAGLEQNYAGRPEYDNAKYIQNTELGVIEKLGYTSYFLIVKDISDWAAKRFAEGFRTRRDCTILRGSAANSITFYNLGVSTLDPVRHDLYFQRFLNEDRASPPDADLDFGHDEREHALGYLVDKWGRDRVAITCTTNHFRGRAAFRETAKVFGYSEEQITAILKSSRTSRAIEDDEIRHLHTLAGKITGKPRFLGQHPGGVLITNGPIRRHVACEYSGQSGSGRIVTQIDMHSGIDELGLIKFDILGNGSISVLRDTLHQLGEQGIPDPDVSDVDKCCNDPTVRDMVRNGKTRGIFYIESPAQMRLNTKAQAETFEEVTQTSSLVRPAGTKYISTYVERHRKMKMGIRDWEFLHPSLEPILHATHDVCAYQEDVTKICHQVAGLPYRRTDKIRKMMNSLHEGILTSDEYAETAHGFIEGCKNHSGLTEAQALELWERVSSFTGFSFCKSHSASYAQLSFKCCYLKAHYPAQFLSAVVSNNHGFYSRDVYLDEARRCGVSVLPVHINQSLIAYHGRHNWLRIGLMHIRGMTQTCMRAVITERRDHGPYHNMIDFVERVSINRKEIESLILVGAFDGFGLTQPESLFLLDDICGRAGNETPSLFDNTSKFTHDKLHPGLTDYTFTRRCLNELAILGFMVSGNILDILDLHPESKNTVAAADICRHTGRRIKIFGWPVTNRLHMADNARPMLFMTLEDSTGCMDVLFWPDVYARFSDELTETGPFAVTGRVSEDWDSFTVEADTVRTVAWSPAIVDFNIASRRLQNSYKSTVECNGAASAA